MFCFLLRLTSLTSFYLAQLRQPLFNLFLSSFRFWSDFVMWYIVLHSLCCLQFAYPLWGMSGWLQLVYKGHTCIYRSLVLISNHPLWLFWTIRNYFWGCQVRWPRHRTSVWTWNRTLSATRARHISLSRVLPLATSLEVTSPARL